jgi:hypothetical protein
VALPVKLPSLSRPPVTTSTLQCCHLCARALEPLCRFLISCSIVSALLAAPPPSSLRQPGCLRQGLDDEALEQPALLAKLQLPKACRAGHRLALPARVRSLVRKVRCRPSLHRADTWMPPYPAHYPDVDVRINAAHVDIFTWAVQSPAVMGSVMPHNSVTRCTSCGPRCGLSTASTLGHTVPGNASSLRSTSVRSLAIGVVTGELPQAVPWHVL